MNTPTLRASVAAAALLSLALAAAAQEGLPKRKAGLWEVAMQVQGQGGVPAMNSKQCVDARSDEEMQRKALSGSDLKSQCRQLSSKKIPGGQEIEVECKAQDGGTTRVLSRMTGDMQANYTVDSSMTFTPPRHGMSNAKMTMTATHRGACPAGMKPGDVQMGAMAMPGGAGIDLEKLKNMSPEERRKWAEQMQKSTGKP
jgi:hypothetical protein